MSGVLQSDLFWGILSHVPPKPLLRFRCVCLEWRQIIDDPTFIQSHLQCQAGCEQVMIRSGYGKELYTLSLEALYNFEKPISARPFKILTRHGVYPIPVLPVFTCNGLILCIENKVWSLLNPFTRESIELPPYVEPGFWPCSGLGYDPATNDYKVVRISQLLEHNTYKLETLIYSLKLNCWSRTDDFPNCCVKQLTEDGVYVNGGLHWMTHVRLRDGTNDEMIITFDLGTENYRLLPLPSNLFAPNKHLVDVHKNLSVLGGCLFLSCTYSNIHSKFRADGWIMKDSCGGGTNLWTKLFSFIPQCEIGKGELRFIAYFKNKGQVLIQHKDNELFWLDIEKKSAKRIIVRGNPDYFTSQAIPATLVRLNDNSRGDNGSIFAISNSRKEDELVEEYYDI